MTRAVFLASLALAGAVAGQEPLRIGVLNDQSSVYADFQGKGSVLAAQMAVEDYGGEGAGRKVGGGFAEHPKKPPIGSGGARQWGASEGGGVPLGVCTPRRARRGG